MHRNQTLEYVIKKKQQYSKLNNCKMSIKKALSMMDEFIDPSDPDLDVENSIHAYQTAERINVQTKLSKITSKHLTTTSA